MNEFETPAELQALVESLETVDAPSVVDTDAMSKAYSVVAN